MIGFADFFRCVHGRGATPYPWQLRFAERCADSAPPPLVCAPTGTGKTAVVDALLWALARQADRPAAERTIGVRTIWAIDRRILVDEVHEHADGLARRLLEARDDPGNSLHRMAVRLAALSGDRPLVATRWRGGIRDEQELLGPMQPQIITSTVAQVGSRLLFRGYGVGRGSLALQAGLAACDTTICLDEAHLAEPFSQTAQAIRAHREGSESGLRLPQLNVITLTATPSDVTEDAIRLTDEDERALAGRLKAEKWATLDDSTTTDRERVGRLADLATAYVEDGLPTVACVTNTVKQARDVFDRLAKKLPGDEVALVLLIGPQRPADREEILKKAEPLFADGPPPQRPLVCVATQTFEVGLDADVAAMVTESASASALVQRLGRLNRRGKAVGRATIVREENSWLYGEDEALAWEWLLSRRQASGEIDVSVSAIDRDESRPGPLHVPSAPALTAAVVDLLTQTAPLPGRYQDPDVEPFLRGAGSEPSLDVALCWRCDLRPKEVDGEADRRRAMLLELFPPGRREQLALSLRSAKALLSALYPTPRTRLSAAKAALTDADIEGRAPAGDVPVATADKLPGRPFVVIRRGEVLQGSLGDGGDTYVRPGDLEPGDVVVLPTRAGGVDEHGLNPDPTKEATDVAADLRPGPDIDAARISPEVLGAARSKETSRDELSRAQWARAARLCRQAELESTNGNSSTVITLVNELTRHFPTYAALTRLSEAAANGSRLAIRSIGPTASVTFEPEPEPEPSEFEAGEPQLDGEVDSDADVAAAPAAGLMWVIVSAPVNHRERGDRTSADPPPTLTAHAEAVRDRTREFAQVAGLPPTVAAALELAARAHDHGKADPRIQAFFRRGVEPIGEPPLAKSVFGTRDPRTSRIAAELAGLPRSLHHEIASVAILADALQPNGVDDGLDQDLALHLVATHHGRARPIPTSPLGGAAPRAFHCDGAGVSGSARGDGIEGWMSGDGLHRFWAIVGRYGAWGTAYLEALLMLADRTISSEGR